MPQSFQPGKDFFTGSPGCQRMEPLPAHFPSKEPTPRVGSEGSACPLKFGLEQGQSIAVFSVSLRPSVLAKQIVVPPPAHLPRSFLSYLLIRASPADAGPMDSKPTVPVRKHLAESQIRRAADGGYSNIPQSWVKMRVAGSACVGAKFYLPHHTSTLAADN